MKCCTYTWMFCEGFYLHQLLSNAFSPPRSIICISVFGWGKYTVGWKSSRSFSHSWLITGFVTRLTRRVSLVEQELLTLPEHPSPPPNFSGVRVTQSLVFCVMFCRLLFVLLSFSFGNCVVCPSSIYGLWFPLWCLQTVVELLSPLLIFVLHIICNNHLI